MPLRLIPDEFVRELILVRSSLVDDGEWLISCSGDDVRSLVVIFGFPRNELRRLVEPLRLIERLNESLKKKLEFEDYNFPFVFVFIYPRLTNPFDVVLNCLTR
jgi:hypothetical protein